MKERWTENEILALPDGEHDFFERKSGALLGTDDWRVKLSKALSAFANSGGGHIILGQKDDGQFDGVDATRGGTELREWLEQVIPPLTSYPLSLFRVHTATPAAPTAIPAGKQVIVIDIGDSPIAPHQASVPNDKRQYYYREGGHSKPAPHHYLEAVRTRFVAAQLDIECVSLSVRKVHRAAENRSLPAPIGEFDVAFNVTNTSRVACYKWAVDVILKNRPISIVTQQEFPPIGRSNNIALDSTILPTRFVREHQYFGVRLKDEKSYERTLGTEVLPMHIAFRAIGEHFVGEYHEIALSEVADFQSLNSQLEAKFKETH